MPRPRLDRVLLTALAAVVLIATGVVALVRSEESGVTPARGPLVPERGALFGAWIRPATLGVDDTKAAITGLEERIGRTLDISHHFYPWHHEFPSWREAWDVERGRIPMVSWAGNDTREITNGRHDAVIRARARAVADFGEPLFMRWMWEMDARPEAHGGEAFVAAWKHVRAVFADEGADNAVWVWCPTSFGFDNERATPYYPGGDHVDWVCADGYNWAPGREGARYRSWLSIYERAHEFALKVGKPLMAGEFGVQEREPGEKADWFDAARRAIAESQPAIKAVVYFDESKRFDWRSDTTPESEAAFRAFARDPYFDTRDTRS